MVKNTSKTPKLGLFGWTLTCRWCWGALAYASHLESFLGSFLACPSLFGPVGLTPCSSPSLEDGLLRLSWGLRHVAKLLFPAPSRSPPSTWGHSLRGSG